MELPSKELLTAVLGVSPIVEMEYELDLDYNTAFIRTNSGKETWYPYYLIDPTITIVSDLAHICKEWASISYSQALSSYPRWGNTRDYPDTNGRYYVCQHLVTGAQFEATTEPEAIFKACEWVLKNKTFLPISKPLVNFLDIIKEHNLKKFPSGFSEEDIELPYIFDLLWDIKSIGHLDYALNSEYLHRPGKDIYEIMEDYGLTEDNLKYFYTPN